MLIVRAKAVAEGAVGFFLDHYVSARVAKYTYGVYSSPRFNPANPQHMLREHLVYTNPSGKKHVSGGFSTHLRRVGRSYAENRAILIPVY
jgi:hypothetical protein